MRTLVLGFLSTLLFSGCVTTSTIESRRRERESSYAALRPEQKIAIDLGQVREGMNADAACIAWGKPTEKVSDGATTTWYYRESCLKEHKSMTVRTVQDRSGGGVFVEETTMLFPHKVMCGKIVFQNGSVKEWLRMDGPAY